jgi:hypothetical protein
MDMGNAAQKTALRCTGSLVVLRPDVRHACSFAGCKGCKGKAYHTQVVYIDNIFMNNTT